MPDYTLYELENAPEGSKPFMQAAKDKFGFVPNVLKIQAEAPALIKGYLTLTGIFSESGLSPAEQQIILLSASIANECHYCGAAHTMVATMAGVSSENVEAIRSGGALSDPKLNALSVLTKLVIKERGWVKEADQDAFLEAGYTKADIMHVVLGIAVKTMTHYVNHMADTPVDEQFEKFKL